MISSETEKKARYGLASSWSRILARFIDFIFVYFVLGVFTVLLLTTDPNVSGWSDIINLNISQTWRYLLITVISFLIMFIYFVLIPNWWGGRTIGKWILKLRTWNLIPTKSFIVGLVKKEFFIWIIVGIINLVLGIFLALSSINDAKEILNQIFASKKSENNFGISMFFQAFYYGYSIVLLALVIYMIIKDKKRCFQDKISDTVVIKFVDQHSNDLDSSYNKKTKKITKNYGLPGEIKQEAVDEINSF